MVFPNFFITFVRHSFHTSHPCTSPSRERRHRPAPPYHQAPHSLMAHALPRYAHATLSRAAPRKGAMLTRHAHATHPRPSQHTPPHYNPSQRAMPHALLSLTAHTPPTLQPSQRAMSHALLSLTAHTPSPPPQRAMPRTRPTRKNAAMLFLASPLLSKKKERASTTKILHITILHVTFTRIGVKTTQKSEAIFSFID